nr:hypothetical protein OG781_42730 [Streptomyces sp. NBC_00830]
MRLSSATPEAYAVEPARRLRQIASAAHAEINNRRARIAWVLSNEGDLSTDLLSQLVATQQWHQVWRRLAERVDDPSVLVGTVYERINEAPDGLLVLVARSLRTDFRQEQPRVEKEFAYQWRAAQTRYLAETAFLDGVPTVESLGDDAS